MSLRVKPAGPEDLREALRLLDIAFPLQDNLYYLTGDPGYRHERTRLILEGRRPVGVLQIFERRVRWEDGSKRVGCVANLTVHPTRRRRGYASKLLEDAVNYMRGEGFEYSLLFTRIPEFYERLGWRRIPLTLLSGTLKNRFETRLKGVVRRMRVDADLKPLVNLYSRFNRGRWGTVVRTERLWRSELKWLFDEDLNRFMVYVEGAVKAYVRGHKHHPYVTEFGFERGCEDAAWALIRRCASGFNHSGGRIYLPALKDPSIDGFLKAQLADVKEVSTDQIGLEHMMIKALEGEVEENVLNRIFFWYPDHF